MPERHIGMVVGLGNPGKTYADTRHNAGFMVTDEIATAYSIALHNRKFDAVFGRGRIGSCEILLVKPLAYMNRSGRPVQALMNYFRISSEDLVIIHDDIDLALGRLKIKEKGGHGGHNGLRSIIDTLGTDRFIRVRIGVGRGVSPENEDNTVTRHVLGRFRESERRIMTQIVLSGKAAVETIVSLGAREGMNRFNNTRLQV